MSFISVVFSVLIFASFTSAYSQSGDIYIPTLAHVSETEEQSFTGELNCVGEGVNQQGYQLKFKIMVSYVKSKLDKFKVTKTATLSDLPPAIEKMEFSEIFGKEINHLFHVTAVIKTLKNYEYKRSAVLSFLGKEKKSLTYTELSQKDGENIQKVTDFAYAKCTSLEQ